MDGFKFVELMVDTNRELWVGSSVVTVEGKEIMKGETLMSGVMRSESQTCTMTTLGNHEKILLFTRIRLPNAKILFPFASYALVPQAPLATFNLRFLQ